MSTNIRQMIDALEEIAAEYGDETQVLAAHQPNYPLAERVTAFVVTKVDGSGNLIGDEEDADICESEGCDDNGIVHSREHDKVFCVRHAEEVGVDMMDLEETPLVWVLLGGHPNEYGDDAWKSPYASSALWNESVGTAYSMQ